MFVRSIEIPIYDMDIVVVIHKDPAEVIKKFKLDLDPNEYNDALAFSFADPETQVAGRLEVYIWFSPDVDTDTVFHEHAHLLSYFSIHRDVKFDPNNDEPFAYFSGYVGGKVMEIIEIYKKTKS